MLKKNIFKMLQILKYHSLCIYLVKSLLYIALNVISPHIIFVVFLQIEISIFTQIITFMALDENLK